MPLKLIYGKAPLTELSSMMLRPGQVRMDHANMKTVNALLNEDIASHPARWEASVRLSALTQETTAAAACIADALASQQEDGSFAGMNMEDSLHTARAAWATYEIEPSRNVLEQLMRWCAYLAAHWDEAMACQTLRVRTGDLMALLCDLYRVTGKKAVLSLCEKLRREGMDWSGILHTFSVQRPMKRVISAADLEEGMAAEQGEADGFYTRQYLTCHGETLADGARATIMSAVYSGNGSESTAARMGWEKISRWHGAVCGGVTADETLAGTSPVAALDTAAAGAWAEAFAAQVTEKESAWACDALETLMENAMPAAVLEDRLIPFQRVNSLPAKGGAADCYRVSEGQPERALTRLARGYAAAAYAAVTARKTGADVNLYLPGQYTMKLGDVTVRLTLEGGDGRYTLRVAAKHPVKAAIRLRVPAWAEDACIRVNDEGADEGHAGEYLSLERMWNDGDTVHIDYAKKLRVAEGYHQSAAVIYGAQVMAYLPGEKDWAVALCGEPSVKDGRVVAPLCPVDAWKSDMPVRPEAKGEAVETELTPYADALCRVAQFPRCKA